MKIKVMSNAGVVITTVDVEYDYIKCLYHVIYQPKHIDTVEYRISWKDYKEFVDTAYEI